MQVNWFRFVFGLKCTKQLEILIFPQQNLVTIIAAIVILDIKSKTSGNGWQLFPVSLHAQLDTNLWYNYIHQLQIIFFFWYIIMSYFLQFPIAPLIKRYCYSFLSIRERFLFVKERENAAFVSTCVCVSGARWVGGRLVPNHIIMYTCANQIILIILYQRG